MKFRGEWSTAAAATATVAGLCFASGRTFAMFFAQTGWASWLGIGTAGLVFGLLAGGTCRLAQTSGVRSVPGMLVRSTGAAFGAAAGIVHGMLMLLTGIAMLCISGNLAALVLPLKNARQMGMLSALTAALMICRNNMRGRKGSGTATIAACTVFFILLYLDPRPVCFRSSYETTAHLAGLLPEAAALGVLFGVMCALVCADAVVRNADAAGGSVRFGMRCGAILTALLVPANAAVLRGGEKLLSQALPAVILAARWGTIGFYVCAAMMYLCAVMTLAAAVGTGGKHDKIT